MHGRSSGSLEGASNGVLNFDIHDPCVTSPRNMVSLFTLGVYSTLAVPFKKKMIVSEGIVRS